MFVREKKNNSGSISVQVVSKTSRKYKIVKTIGCSRNLDEISRLVIQAKQYINQASRQLQLFSVKSSTELAIEAFIANLSNFNIVTMGPELIFGSLFDRIGLDKVDDELFRHLVIARLAYPTSKLGTVDYLQRYQHKRIEISQLYRFLDELADKHQEQIEKIIFNHTKQLLGGHVQVVFYDLTTLYFETESEDDLRKIGFSKDGKFNHPQIMMGLLTTTNGYPLGYELFSGNTFEGKTLIPAIQRLEEKFGLDKPVVVADAGLLSKSNLESLREAQYKYIIGARIKNESSKIKQQILNLNLSSQNPLGVISKHSNLRKKYLTRLVVSYSATRVRKDQYNRKKGLRRLEKKVKTGKLTKSHINNRGYNKYLQLKGRVEIKIDYQKFEADSKWDGLKGYITNTKLKPETIITHYSNLWLIEKAFRISKTDLKIRPIYHYRQNRIEAHLSIVFAAYAVYKELERLLKKHHMPLSIKRAANLTHNMYALCYIDPETKLQKQIILQMDKEQKLLFKLIHKDKY